MESSYDKAVLLNSYFYECFNKLIPPLDDHQPQLNPTNFPAELMCTEEEVFDLLAELDCNKSTGPDNISARMLKGTATSVTPSLTRLFNLSLTTGCFPDAWKLARVVPVPSLQICLRLQTTDQFLSSPSSVRSWNELSID